MKAAAQLLELTGLSLRSMPRRLGNALVVVVSMAGVVAVLLAVLAMYANFRQTLQADGRADRALVMSRTATAEDDSSLSLEDIAAITNAPGIRHDRNDRPLVSPEIILAAPVARKRDRSDVNITLRGVGEQYFVIRPELKLTAGRMYRSGTQELVVGNAARQQFVGLGLGDRVRLQGGDWTIVGVYAGDAGARESEVVGDLKTIMSAYKLDGANSLTVLLDGPRALGQMKDALQAQATLHLQVLTEPDYLATAAGPTNRLLRLVAYAVGSIMALGAFFAALNSTHSAVAARTVEMATLRAIGFVGAAVAASILLEALLLSLAGAAIGALLAYTAFNGTVISTLGGAVWDAQLVYALIITPPLIGLAVLIAGTVGMLGGLIPALGAARANVADALHET
jgi:putative ABC transport system permease protein